MSLLTRVLQGTEKRATLANPDSSLTSAFGAEPGYSGKSVSVDNSLALVPVFSAVRLLSTAIGSLPLKVYRRVEGGRETAQNHPMWRLVHDEPNPRMAADEVWGLVMVHLLLWGNAFVGKVHGNLGTVTELWPLRPSRVQVGEENGRLYYLLDGKSERYTDEDILHIRGMGDDGVVGYSPIQQARQMLGNTMALEEFSGRFWANGAFQGGVLKHPNKLSPDAAERLAESWRAKSGVSRAGQTRVLEEGMEWQATGMPLEDAQFIETAKFNDLRVAQLFGIPPYTLGASSGDSMTYANVESQGIAFVNLSLRHWLVRIERALFTDPSLFLQGNRFYPEFLVEGMQRADTKTRYESYAIALDPAKGWMDRSEVRELENLNPEDEPEAPPEPVETIPVAVGAPDDEEEPDVGD